ncbi:MAG: hypothetical protein CYPHOPRED_005253 [Cyphobasidiales sp. Tagirdzhanova-0007]|nr:MAG: hypothetical protein CYPHOPRED_005253 [Cyphobasidiales sp. Tagirdzhanova-0007]
MSGRQGGKAKPLKAPKKKPTDADEDEDDKAHKAKMAADKKARDTLAKSLAGKKGPLSLE